MCADAVRYAPAATDKCLLTDRHTEGDGEGQETSDEISMSSVLQNVQGRADGAGLLQFRDTGMDHELRQMGKAALVRPLIPAVLLHTRRGFLWNN